MSEFPGYVDELTSDKETRENDTDWIRFGRAVILCAARIDVNLLDGKYSKTIIKSDKDFFAAQNWVTEHFANRLNFTVSNPSYRAVRYVNWIALYSDETDRRESHLVSFPLNAKTFGFGGDKLIRELEELKNLIC